MREQAVKVAIEIMNRYKVDGMPRPLLVDMIVREINVSRMWSYDTQENVSKALVEECADPQGKLIRVRGMSGGIFRRDVDKCPCGIVRSRCQHHNGQHVAVVKSDKVCRCGKPNDHDAKKCWMCERTF